MGVYFDSSHSPGPSSIIHLSVCPSVSMCQAETKYYYLGGLVQLQALELDHRENYLRASVFIL